MTDPIAEAAAKIAAEQAPTGLIGELAAGLHKLEETVEHIIHPEAAHDAAVATPVAADSAGTPAAGAVVTEDAAPSSTEPVPNVLAGTAAPSSGLSAIAPTVSETGGEGSQEGESLKAGDAPVAAGAGAAPSTSPSLGASPNAAPTPPAGVATPVAGEAGNVQPDTSDGAATDALAGAGESPNVAASPAAGVSENSTPSSAPPASPSADTQAVSASAVSAIRARIAAIKGHLLGFEESSRQKIHSELDAIEGLL